MLSFHFFVCFYGYEKQFFGVFFIDKTTKKTQVWQKIKVNNFIISVKNRWIGSDIEQKN